MTGDRKGTVSLSVTRNRRLTFRINAAEPEIYDVTKGAAPMSMKNPPHPGDFIRTEIIEPAGLSVTAAATSQHQIVSISQEPICSRLMPSRCCST